MTSWRRLNQANSAQKFREGLVISLGNDETTDQNLGRCREVRTTCTATNSQAGLSLREMIHEFKYQTLVLFKGLLLEPKVYNDMSL